MASASLLLLCTLSLWVLQTTMPAFQAYLPYISLSWSSTPLRIPLSQVLTYLAGLLCYLLAYCLMHERSGGKLSLKTNVLFLLCGYMVSYGQGMHSVCVMVEGKENSISDSMAAYVDFLHEVISHNMFVCGIYAMMMLVIKEERRSLDFKPSKKPESANGAIKSASNLRNGRIPSSEVSMMFLSGASTVQNFLLKWTWPVFLGSYFSVFSFMTGTVAITVVFYMLIYSYSIYTCQQLNSSGIPLGTVLDSELFVWATVVKAACVGLPALGVWAWLAW